MHRHASRSLRPKLWWSCLLRTWGDYTPLAGFVSPRKRRERHDRQGHITGQGPGRVRKVLCQAVWARVRSDRQARAAYEAVAARHPKHKKIAVVAMMRRLAILMWHAGMASWES